MKTTGEIEILKNLIRNKFDKLKGQDLIDGAPRLIYTAHNNGFHDLAAEMQKDLDFELQLPNAA